MSIKWYVDDGGQLNGLRTLAQQPACRSKNNRLEKCAPLSCICNGFVEWPRIEMHWHFNWLASSKHHFVIWFFEPSPPPTNSGLLVTQNVCQFNWGYFDHFHIHSRRWNNVHIQPFIPNRHFTVYENFPRFREIAFLCSYIFCVCVYDMRGSRQLRSYCERSVGSE